MSLTKHGWCLLGSDCNRFSGGHLFNVRSKKINYIQDFADLKAMHLHTDNDEESATRS